jgi:hypothetical protein
MKKLIKQILKETINTKVTNLVLDRLKSGRIKPPYIKNLEDLGLSEEEIKITLEEFTGGEYINFGHYGIIKKNNRNIYDEDSQFWHIFQYDENDNLVYTENSNDYWVKYRYNKDGWVIYKEDTYGVLIDR